MIGTVFWLLGVAVGWGFRRVRCTRSVYDLGVAKQRLLHLVKTNTGKYTKITREYTVTPYILSQSLPPTSRRHHCGPHRISLPPNTEAIATLTLTAMTTRRSRPLMMAMRKGAL